MHRAAALMIALMTVCAHAAPSQCLGTGGSLVIVDETFIINLAPDGFENQLKATLCKPLIQRPGILFDYSSWDIGVFNYLSPVYDMQGITVGVVPLSFLELRVDAAAIGIWQLPVEGAGYFALPNYTKKFNGKDLPAEHAASSYGASVTLGARLQAEVPVGQQHLVITNTTQAEYWYVAGGPYNYNLRRDVVLARSDWLVKNNATIAFKVKASDTVSLQFGVQDDFTFVPASNYVANIIGAFISVPIRRNGILRDIEPFARFGAFTHHAFRVGFQLFGGISIAWGMPVGAKPLAAAF